MDMVQELYLGQQQRISRHLIQSNFILQLSSLELQQTIQQEEAENPALDVVENILCPICHHALPDGLARRCPHCFNLLGDGTPPAHADVISTLDRDMDAPTYVQPDGDDTYDPLNFAAAPQSLADRLFAELAVILDSLVHLQIADYLTGNLDERGWLRCTVSEVSAALQVSEAEVATVLGHLQSLDPTGVGAYTLGECLLLQVAALERQGHDLSLVRAIITDHFEALATHRYRQIAHALHVDIESVSMACAFVRERLTPFPVDRLASEARHTMPETANHIRPDVIITIGDDGELCAEVVEARRTTLTIHPSYHHALAYIEANPAAMSPEEKDHIRRYVQRAQMFMSHLRQRSQTLQRITAFLCDYQRAYLLEGVRSLRPLTRTMVAQATGLHQTTIGRAMAGKYVMIPNGQIVPFSDFVTAALTVKDAITAIVEQETTPLTDQVIVTQLAEQGYYIARRTVAKYRGEIGVLPAALRLKPQVSGLSRSESDLRLTGQHTNGQHTNGQHTNGQHTNGQHTNGHTSRRAHSERRPRQRSV